MCLFSLSLSLSLSLLIARGRTGEVEEVTLPPEEHADPESQWALVTFVPAPYILYGNI